MCLVQYTDCFPAIRLEQLLKYRVLYRLRLRFCDYELHGTKHVAKAPPDFFTKTVVYVYGREYLQKIKK
jgi:hypothetical protein